MKNLLAFMVLFLFVTSCTNLQTVGGGAVGLSRTDELLMAGYTWEQIEQAKANGQFNQLVKQVRASGAIQRGDAQRVLQIQNENRQRKAQAEAQRQERIAQAQQAQYNAYINQKKATCKSYGYSESNGMAQCVEREINAERARLNAQAAQQNRINQENFQRQQQGLRDLADIFGKMGEGNYGQQQQEKIEKVCVYICDFETVTTTDSICPYQISYKGSVCYQD